METLKQEINAISKLPDTVNVDEIMYELYVIGKVRRGKVAAGQGDAISTEELKKEMRSW